MARKPSNGTTKHSKRRAKSVSGRRPTASRCSMISGTKRSHSHEALTFIVVTTAFYPKGKPMRSRNVLIAVTLLFLAGIWSVLARGDEKDKDRGEANESVTTLDR